MWRKMRRSRQELSLAEAEEILRGQTNGVLALNGDDGYPYAVPVSYVYADGKIFYHSALSGHKMDALERSDKVTFCVVAQDLIVPEKFTSYFKSVIVFGRARLLTDEAERMAAMKLLSLKYSADFMDGFSAEYEALKKVTAVIEITAEHISGKQAKELIPRKTAGAGSAADAAGTASAAGTAGAADDAQ